MQFTIRPIRDEDAVALAATLQLAIKSTTLRYYAEEQTTAWAARMPDATRLIARCHDGRIAFVAIDENDQPIALGDLEPDGHLDYLYCHPDHICQGVASALYDQLEIIAKALNFAEIYVEASEAALMFFRHKGFTTTKRCDFDMDGVKIHNYAMRKGLMP
jgi:putative acetyltransferase